MLSHIKRILASGIGKVIDLDGIIRIRSDRYIFCYHRVVPAEQAKMEGIHPALWISPEGLSSHIAWMKQVGEITDHHRILEDGWTQKPLFSLTFDDGWKDNYTNALPVLKEHDVPALIFLATDAIETGRLFWTEDVAIKTQRKISKSGYAAVRNSLTACFPEAVRLRIESDQSVSAATQMWIEKLKLVAPADRKKLIDAYYSLLGVETSPLDGFVLNWTEIREMLKNNISFGSHTHQHVILEDLATDQIEEELKQSKTVISEKLQLEADSFCYPNGRYSGKEGKFLALAGYKYGFCLDNKPLSERMNNHYIPRVLVSEQKISNPSFFKLCLLQVPFFKSRPHRTSVDPS